MDTSSGRHHWSCTHGDSSMLGKWSSEASCHVRPGCWFRPTRGFGFTEGVCNGDLTKTLMLLELCEFYCAGTAPLNGADLRCRRCGWVTFGAEGVKGPEAPRVGCAPTQGWGRSGRDVLEARCDRSGVACRFGAEGAARMLVSAPSRGLRNTWPQQPCKGAPYEAETRGAACKGGLAVRRHAGGLYDAGSYCYTLVKCLKPR
jgi:hypothetical protein